MSSLTKTHRVFGNVSITVRKKGGGSYTAKPGKSINKPVITHHSAINTPLKVSTATKGKDTTTTVSPQYPLKAKPITKKRTIFETTTPVSPVISRKSNKKPLTVTKIGKSDKFERKVEKLIDWERSARQRQDRLQNFWRRIPGLKGDNWAPRNTRSLLSVPATLTVGLGETIMLTGAKTAAFTEGLIRKDSRERAKAGLKKAAKQTPLVIAQSYDPRSGDFVANVIMTGLAVKGISNARLNTIRNAPPVKTGSYQFKVNQKVSATATSPKSSGIPVRTKRPQINFKGIEYTKSLFPKKVKMKAKVTTAGNFIKTQTIGKNMWKTRINKGSNTATITKFVKGKQVSKINTKVTPDNIRLININKFQRLSKPRVKGKTAKRGVVTEKHYKISGKGVTGGALSRQETLITHKVAPSVVSKKGTIISRAYKADKVTRPLKFETKSLGKYKIQPRFKFKSKPRIETVKSYHKYSPTKEIRTPTTRMKVRGIKHTIERAGKTSVKSETKGQFTGSFKVGKKILKTKKSTSTKSMKSFKPKPKKLKREGKLKVIHKGGQTVKTVHKTGQRSSTVPVVEVANPVNPAINWNLATRNPMLRSVSSPGMIVPPVIRPATLSPAYKTPTKPDTMTTVQTAVAPRRKTSIDADTKPDVKPIKTAEPVGKLIKLPKTFPDTHKEKIVELAITTGIPIPTLIRRIRGGLPVPTGSPTGYVKWTPKKYYAPKRQNYYVDPIVRITGQKKRHKKISQMLRRKYGSFHV